MFKDKSNTTFNNSVFSGAKILLMHETMKRLYLAANELLKTDGQSNVARLMNQSPQTLKNWESRGISADGMLIAEQSIGCSALWLKTGQGSMSSISLLPSSNTQKESKSAESDHANDKDSAMLLKFPKMSPDTILAPDNYTIRQYAAGGAMGHGLTLPEQPGVIENWSVSREWLNKNVRNHTSVQNLCIVTGFGPSMQPMFNPGDPLLVDTGVKSVIADGVYFFRVEKEGFIKQLQKIPTAAGLKYVAKSMNKNFDPFEITPDMDFEILGKVVRVWCGTDF